MQKTLFYLEPRDGLGVPFKSYTEPSLDTS